MFIDYATREIILERKPCHCGDGTTSTKKWRECPKCKGTGKRGKGRCRNCNDRTAYYGKELRPGYESYYDQEDRQPCPYCKGHPEDYLPENWTDCLPDEVWLATQSMTDPTKYFVPIKIIVLHSDQSWQEQHLGSGLYTIVDYGDTSSH